jgi:hypothetical protein
MIVMIAEVIVMKITYMMIIMMMMQIADDVWVMIDNCLDFN